MCQQFGHNYDSLLESSSLHLNALERPLVLEVHVRMWSEQDGSSTSGSNFSMCLSYILLLKCFLPAMHMGVDNIF